MKKLTILNAFILTLLLFSGQNILFAQEDEEGFHIGGAVRYNLLLEDYEDDITASDANFTWDTWRINVSGMSKGIYLDFEYRFYPTFSTHFIHHGWLGYKFNKNSMIQLGVTQVPFGNLKYASHSWWFVTPYYVGLEDDYDMGLKYLLTTGDWDIQLAYFMMAEPNGPANLEFDGVQLANATARYSYDIVPSSTASITERNQFNARVAYNWKHNEKATTEIGASGQYGQLFNSTVEDNPELLEDMEGFDEWGYHLAAAGHINGTYGNFNVKAEYVYFYHEVNDDEGNEMNLIPFGAYGFGTYPVASEASMYVIGAAYTFDLDYGPLDAITFYDDYTYTDKAMEEFEPTQQNILGFSVAAGSVFTYFDIAMGKNQPWLTNSFGTGLGQGVADADWNIRYNINIGYYF